MAALPLEIQLKLRPASMEDAEVLFEIRCSVIENHQSREELAALGITPASVGQMIAGGDYATIIAEADGRPVGFTMAQLSAGYVFACFVRPAHEGRGIGRALMTAAERVMRDAGVRTAWLSTGRAASRAIGFYHHLGWREDGPVEDGQLRFRKTL